MIQASRDFVCVRLNPWLDERNHQREMALLGNHIGDADDTQNTTFNLFAPDAKGVALDSFPTQESTFFGTRAGRRYTFLPRMAEISKKDATDIVREWVVTDTGDPDPDPELIDRIVWEYQTVVDGDGLATIMGDLTEVYPGRAADGPPLLPVFVDLTQALNVAAADSRAVIAIVPPEEGADEQELHLRHLAYEAGIAGRTHMTRVSMADWARAKETEKVTGGELEAGIFFLSPNYYGYDGEVWVEIASGTRREEVRRQLAEALERFHEEWRKPDRKSFIRHGIDNGITWTEYDPDAGAIIPIGPGSKKLGDGLAKSNE